MTAGVTNIRVAASLSLPLDITTQAIGIVAKRRVGKSYTARRIVEQLLHAGQQVVIVDPKGDWWGVRSSADGRSAGFPVVILGGEHKDVPLGASRGETVAAFVVEERVSVLLDLSELRKREVAVFMADFLETLYRLKAKEALRSPLMLVVDEADAIMPQKPNPGEERMLGAGEDIVRRGGQRGIGCMMISQRTAVLNKNVLTQCEMLVALRTISPQDLKAMQAWIDVHGSVEERDTLMASLPSLPVGDAWFWSPGWPTATGIFQRVHVLPIETFDSGATPRSGEKRVEPKAVADIDLGALSRQMADVIEKAKADDPKELRKEIAALKKQIAAAPEKAVEIPVVDQRAIDRAIASAFRDHEAIVARTAKAVAAVCNLVENIRTDLQLGCKHLVEAVNELSTPKARRDVAVAAPAIKSPSAIRSAPAARRTTASGDRGAIPNTQLRVLDAIADLNALGIARPSRGNVGAWLGVSASSGSFRNYLGALRSADLISYPSDAFVELTTAGRTIAEAGHGPSSIDELHRIWLERLPATQSRILDILLKIAPRKIARSDLASSLGVSHTAGSFRNYLGALRSLGLIDYPSDGSVVATDLLFPEGLR